VNLIEDRAAFIRANTRLLAPPHCPELTLYLADDAVALWQLTEDQMGEIGLAPPFWAFAWAGGQALARYVLDHCAIVRGKAVLDVASGSGLVAIAAMKAGAASAVAADIDPFAADAARLNADINGVKLAAVTASPIGAETQASVVLVGDLFYDSDVAGALLPWLRACARGGREILVGDPGRAYFPKDAFVNVAEYEVPVTRALEDAEVKRTGVWRLTN
jgi:predicted nicotinamide N-methyase